MENKIIVAPLRAKITKIVAVAREVAIKTKEDMESAVDILGKIKKWTNDAEQAKKKITDPLNESLKAARALFAPIEAQGKEAERIVKQKMLAYQTAEEERAAKLIEKVTARVESGSLSFEKGMARIENSEPNRRVEGGKYSLTFREDKKMEIVDVNLIPDEYWVIDEVKLRRDVLGGKEVPGAKIVFIKTPVSR